MDAETHTEDVRSPTIKRRILSGILRQLRKEAGLTEADIKRELRWTTGKLTRIERATWKRPNHRDVQDLLGLYGVTGHRADALVQLAIESREQGWWQRYDDVFRSDYPGLEAGASAIWTYEPTLIPGLFQTTDYATAVVQTEKTSGPEAIKRRVQVRAQRQELLTGDDRPNVWAVIDEAALLRPLGDRKAHLDQLQHLIDVAGYPNVTMQVMPLAAGLHAGVDGAFTILHFPAQLLRSIVYLETATDALLLERPAELERYTLIFDWIRVKALDPDATVTYLQQQMAKLDD